MARLQDLMSPIDVATAVDEGFVRRQVHPDQPVAILN